MAPLVVPIADVPAVALRGATFTYYPSWVGFTTSRFSLTSKSRQVSFFIHPAAIILYAVLKTI